MSAGGVRAGAGRKPVHPMMKKEMISVKLPRWLLDRMANETTSRAVLIEQALRQLKHWEPPEL